MAVIPMKLIPVLLLSCLLTGCLRSRPSPPIPSSYITSQILADVTNPNLLSDYNRMPETTDAQRAAKMLRRNQILNEFIELVNNNYSAFENTFYGVYATYNTGSEMLSMALAQASALATSSQVKTILAAIASGSIGLYASVSKNFLDQQTRPVLVQEMRALRATELAIMQDQNHMGAGVDAYTLETGLSDVNGYYDAGTLTSALQAISQAAAQQSAAAKQLRMQNRKAAPPPPTPAPEPALKVPEPSPITLLLPSTAPSTARLPAGDLWTPAPSYIVDIDSAGAAPAVMVLTKPDRIVLDFNHLKCRASQRIPVGGNVVAVRVGQFRAQPPVTRVVVDLARPRGYHVKTAGNRTTLQID